MKWIPGKQENLLPPIDNADYPKQYVVRIKGDDPHSGWIYIKHETAEEMRDINEDGYWEWLYESESPIANNPTVFPLLQKAHDLFERFMPKEVATDNRKEMAMYEAFHTIKTALAQYNTQSPIANQGGHTEAEDWISVDNSLPENNERVLCITNDVFARMIENSYCQHTDQNEDWFKKSFSHWRRDIKSPEWEKNKEILKK